MFGSNVTGGGLTFGKVLGGISKTLSIANQVIPLYQQAKPMINNAKTILGVLKGLKSDNKKTTLVKEIETQDTKENTKPIRSNSSPTFFQ